MSEHYSISRISYVISLNEMICGERNIEFDVNNKDLVLIFEKINSVTFIQDFRRRIITKTTILLAGMSLIKPFKRANITTALTEGEMFLIDNELSVPWNITQREEEIKDMLVEFSKDGKDHSIDKIYNYLQKNI